MSHWLTLMVIIDLWIWKKQPTSPSGSTACRWQPLHRYWNEEEHKPCLAIVRQFIRIRHRQFGRYTSKELAFKYSVWRRFLRFMPEQEHGKSFFYIESYTVFSLTSWTNLSLHQVLLKGSPFKILNI
jgi:hypothetical protein